MTSVLALEEIAFRAWPAEEVVQEGGWRLRFTHGVTRRANSVWPNQLSTGTPLSERLEAVEALYDAHGLPPTFQISPASEPPDLDRLLAARGYAIEAPVSVETASFEAFRMAGQPPQIATSVLSSPSAEWLHVSVDRGRFAATPEPYLGILSRLAGRGGFALARWKGKPIAVGLGVLEGEWLGVFGMQTLLESRRRRAATAILGALVSWGAARGATRAYLQVEKENAPARALYSASGFSAFYDYHYRVRPPPAG